jgi:hypothetical protein
MDHHRSSPSRATLSVLADQLDSYQGRLAELVTQCRSDDEHEVQVALVEAERSLRVAARHVRRALRCADT